MTINNAKYSTISKLENRIETTILGKRKKATHQEIILPQNISCLMLQLILKELKIEALEHSLYKGCVQKHHPTTLGSFYLYCSLNVYKDRMTS